MEKPVLCWKLCLPLLKQYNLLNSSYKHIAFFLNILMADELKALELSEREEGMKMERSQLK